MVLFALSPFSNILWMTKDRSSDFHDSSANCKLFEALDEKGCNHSHKMTEGILIYQYINFVNTILVSPLVCFAGLADLYKTQLDTEN